MLAGTRSPNISNCMGISEGTMNKRRERGRPALGNVYSKTIMMHEEAFKRWYSTEWKFGSSTGELKAGRAWIMARVSLQELVAGLIKPRGNDLWLAPGC